jgi:hypothetical protein
MISREEGRSDVLEGWVKYGENDVRYDSWKTANTLRKSLSTLAEFRCDVRDDTQYDQEERQLVALWKCRDSSTVQGVGRQRGESRKVRRGRK